MQHFTDRIDRRYAKICLYAGVTVVLTVVAIMVLRFASPVFAKLWLLICAVAEPMIYGAAISYLLNPLVTGISHFLRDRGILVKNSSTRRVIAIAISLLIVIALIFALVLVFGLMVTRSLSNISLMSLYDLFNAAQGDATDLFGRVEGFLSEWGIANAGGGDYDFLSIFSSAKNFASTVVFATVFSVYFLIDGPRVMRYIGRLCRAVMGRHTMDPTLALSDADRVFSGYFRGQGTDALVVGILSGIVLTVVGVPYAPLIALVTGLGNMIPYVGGPVGFVSIALMCLPSESWTTMIAGFVGLGLVMFIDANVINPHLLSESVEVHPILVLAALIAGGAVGGIAGMLVAVPTAAWIKVQIDRWVVAREAELAAQAEATQGAEDA